MHDQHAGKRWSYGTGGACVILEERPHIYGYFRLPELLLQPAGGLEYPKRLVCAIDSATVRAEWVQMYATGDGEKLAVGAPFQVETTEYSGTLQAVPRGSAMQHFAFDITDAGLIILHEVLRDFCEGYNDQPLAAIEHEGTLIRHIDFEAILGTFFWDLDFTIPFEELQNLRVGGREMIGISDQAFNASAGFAPHPDELALEEDEAFFRTGRTGWKR